MFEGLFQPTHLLIIAGIALLIFGPRKLPEFGKGLGEGIRGFKSAMQGKEDVRELQPAISDQNISCQQEADGSFVQSTRIKPAQPDGPKSDN